MKVSVRLVSVFACVVLCASLAIADGRAQQKPAATGADWPQWRGPTRDGVVSTRLPDRWPEALKKRWEVPVGAGHASPVVSGDRVVVMAREGDQEVVRALDLESVVSDVDRVGDADPGADVLERAPAHDRETPLGTREPGQNRPACGGQRGRRRVLGDLDQRAVEVERH